MSNFTNVLFPFNDEFNHIQSQFSQMIKTVRKKLKFCFTHLSLKCFLWHLQFVTLSSVFFPLILPFFIEQSLLCSMQILINILRLQLSDMFFKISETGFSGIDTSKESVIDMFLIFNKFLFFDNILFYIFEVASKQKFEEIISMKVRYIPIMPKHL